jgi:hypothetical protein
MTPGVREALYVTPEEVELLYREKLLLLEERYQGGDKRALVEAVCLCFSHAHCSLSALQY